MSDSPYVGNELALFAQAARWKSYVASILRPHLGQRVLEVGAGIGGTTSVLCQGGHEEWVCLEPDQEQLEEIENRIETGELAECCRALKGTIRQFAGRPRFDTVLYLDVLEHIEDDRGEARRAAAVLRRGGHLVVVGPAHQWLFTPFDAAIGHFRRYTRRSLEAVVPQDLERVRLDYLDSVGLLASLANRLLLRQHMPTHRQIFTWDKVMVPVSRVMDPITLHRVGKSVVGIWRKL